MNEPAVHPAHMSRTEIDLEVRAFWGQDWYCAGTRQESITPTERTMTIIIRKRGEPLDLSPLQVVP